MNLTLSDIQNLASAFTVNSELTDWRRFLLAAAQPWPVPSVTQLLKTLQSFKSVDVAGSGVVTQEYYMQVGLWFNEDEDLSITKSCTEPLPLDRIRNLLKTTPYTSIVPNEKTLIEDEKKVSNYTGEGIISVATLLKVFHTGGSKDDHRFSNLDKEGSYDKLFIKIYKELGTEDLRTIPVALLLKHPFIQDLINSYQEYKLPDIKIFLQRSEQAHSTDGKNTTCKDINV
ncbi:sperm flagellar protein 2-like [Chroicocephalus ridibundus]|uniref:sperm flagellar protein 2-like n=1 Tax=Chroicocephalus ridibundus TaxID=1192867 RepID=UPI002FDC85DC